MRDVDRQISIDPKTKGTKAPFAEMEYTARAGFRPHRLPKNKPLSTRPQLSSPSNLESTNMPTLGQPQDLPIRLPARQTFNQRDVDACFSCAIATALEARRP